MDTAPEPVRDAVLEKALAIAASLPEGHPARTEIENAGRNLVTLLKFKGMPPTNNPGESGIRRGPVAQRNARCQLRTEEGAWVFSVILSLILTCDKQGAPLDGAFIVLAGGAGPAGIFKVGQVAPNRWGEAGPKSRAAPDGAPWSRRLRAPRQYPDSCVCGQQSPTFGPRGRQRPSRRSPDPLSAPAAVTYALTGFPRSFPPRCMRSQEVSAAQGPSRCRCCRMPRCARGPEIPAPRRAAPRRAAPRRQELRKAGFRKLPLPTSPAFSRSR